MLRTLFECEEGVLLWLVVTRRAYGKRVEVGGPTTSHIVKSLKQLQIHGLSSPKPMMPSRDL